MAQILNPAQQITGLSNSGTTDELGTWNEDVDLTGAPFNVPTDASAVLVYVEAAGGGLWYGMRDPANDTAKSGWQTDHAADNVSPYIVPVSNGTIDIYTENATTTKFWVAAYFEVGAITWLAAGSELTRETTGAGTYVWDFTSDDSAATGIIVVYSELAGDDFPIIGIATATSPTSYSLPIRSQDNGVSPITCFVVPLDSGQAAYVDTTSVTNPRTYNIVGFIKQDMTFIYDDNSGPTESPTGTTYKAGTFDYGSEEGIGCMVAPPANNTGFHAAADSSDTFTGSSAQNQSTAIMHTVDSSGNWNYILESGTPTYEILWFMGPVPADVNLIPAFNVDTYGIF